MFGVKKRAHLRVHNGPLGCNRPIYSKLHVDGPAPICLPSPSQRMMIWQLSHIERRTSDPFTTVAGRLRQGQAESPKKPRNDCMYGSARRGATRSPSQVLQE